MNIGTRSWTPAETEFFAEQELVEIVPNFRGNSLSFVQGTFGPFKPAKPVSVPLWLAVYLKQRKRCDIQIPAWLDIEFLKKVRAEDKANG
jgi:GINS complex subunit 2